MSDNEGLDAGQRAKAYQRLLDLMVDPDDEIIEQVGHVLPTYLADQDPDCQSIAVSLCDVYLKSGYDDIDYEHIAALLAKHCLGSSQTITDLAASDIEICLRNSTMDVVNILFQDIAMKPTPVVVRIIAIFVSFLAGLTSKDEKIVNAIKSRLEPLATHPDFEEPVHKEAASAIDAAKIVLGSDLDTLSSPQKAQKQATTEKWIHLVESGNWKDRKIGYEELLESLSESSDLKVIEKHFLIPAGVEKYTLCEVLVAQIIDKMACVFKSQLLRKLREYTNPIITLLKSKRQSRIQTFQKALDSIAQNVVPSPYEQPFLEILMNMMKSTSAQLREESLNFIQRIGTAKLTQPVKEQISLMTSDQLPAIRKLAQAIVPAAEQSHQQPPPASKPTTAKREGRKKGTVQSMQAAWNNWVDPDTLELLQNSGQWVAVTKGLEQLKSQFEEDPSQVAAVVGGFASLFTGKTFTPKVMANIMGDLLFYLRYEPDKVSDEALTQTVTFCLDKIQDKKYENQVYELLDTVAETRNAEFVFQLFYPHLTAKNPTIPLRIVQYFSHHLSTYRADAGINIAELSEQIKPLFTHANLQIRSTVSDIAKEVKEFDPSAADLFKQVQPKEKQESKLPQPKAERETGKQKEKPESKLPQPKPRNQGEHKKEKKEEEPQPKDESFIPQRLVQAIAKTGSMVDTRKGLDEIEAILSSATSNSVPAAEFSELFVKLRQWFKDSSTNIVLSVIKVITSALRAMKNDEIETVPTEFFCDMCLLLNFAHRGIRQSTIAALTELFGIHKGFFPAIFIPSFFKLNSDGRKTAVTFLKNMLSNIEMTVDDFGGLIMNILQDKSDDFRELSRPILVQFFLLPGAMAAATDMADQLPPAQKNLVLSRLPTFQTHVSIFKCEPANEEREQREQMIDPFLPLKVLNTEEKPEALTEVLTMYSEKYFKDPITSSDAESITKTCEMFLRAATDEYESLSMVLDLVFLWWANQALQIKVQESFNSIIEFLTSLLKVLNHNERVLDKYEFSIILPTVLECLGRYNQTWEEPRDLLFQICDDGDLISVCVQILSMASSVYTIVSTLRTLKLLGASNDLTSYLADLTKSTKKIIGIVENDADKKELHDVAVDFMSFLKTFEEEKSAIPKPKFRRQLQKESPKSSSAIPKFTRKQQTKSDEPEPPEPKKASESPESKKTHEAPETKKASESPETKKASEAPEPKKTSQIPESRKMPEEVEIVEEAPKYAKTSTCDLSDEVTKAANSPPVLLYQWIADVNSSDGHQVITALKAITGQLKENWSLFSPHSDALMLTLVAKLRSQLETNPLPIRVCKYVSFCIVTLISNADLVATISCNYVPTLTADLIKFLGTGVTEPIINQVLNAILVQLIEKSPGKAFDALLQSVNDIENKNEKEVKLAVKCLEASGVRLCECGQTAEINAAVSLANQYLESHWQENSTEAEAKVSAALKSFTNLASSKSSPSHDPVRTQAPPRIQGKNNARRIISPDVSKRPSPLKDLRSRS